jgi:magnesium chelatase family protein
VPTTIRSCTIRGLEGMLVEVAIELSPKSDIFLIMGLSDDASEQLKERLYSAIHTSGYLLPSQGVNAHLAPEDLSTDGLEHTLALAIGILQASQQISPGRDLTECLFFGDLSRDGQIQHIPGILSMVIVAREKQIASVFVPAVDIKEAALVPEVTLYPVETLQQVVSHLNGWQPIEPYIARTDFLSSTASGVSGLDMSAIRGQEHVKRAIEVAISGGHHLLLSSTPEIDTFCFAQAALSLLPPMEIHEMLEVTAIYSASNLLGADDPLMTHRPLRAPQRTVSTSKLIGSPGPLPRPGEVSLAHCGILYFSEVSVFHQSVLDQLHQPLAEKKAKLMWEQSLIIYPANCLVAARMQPCPCGYAQDPIEVCHCVPAAIEQYQKSMSRALLAHFDISVEVPRVDAEKLAKKRQVETSSTIRSRVQDARERQLHRFAKTELRLNAEMGMLEVASFCTLEVSAQKLWEAASQQLHLSTTVRHRILRVARTIADLAVCDVIEAQHLAEAIHYRPRLLYTP